MSTYATAPTKTPRPPSMDHVVLDAVLEWLDVGALLAAGGVCRAWRERAVRPEAWRARAFPLAWARGMDARRAWGVSWGALGRWRRGAWSERRTETPIRGDTVCADGDWLAGEPTTDRCADSLVLHNVATGRHTALPVARGRGEYTSAVALDHRRGLVAMFSRLPTIPFCRFDVWSGCDGDGERDGEGAVAGHATYTCPIALATVGPGRDSLWEESVVLAWHGDALTMCMTSVQKTAHVWRLAIRDDGVLQPLETRAYPYGFWHGNAAFAASHDELYLVASGRAHAIDPRHGDALPGPPYAGVGYHESALPVGDGRHVAAVASDRLTYYDVRAASAPVELHAPTALHRRALCGTSRGTVLLWATDGRSCADTFAGRRFLLREWDPRDGAVRDLHALSHASGKIRAACADERRIALFAAGRQDQDELCVLDATERGPFSPRVPPSPDWRYHAERTHVR